MSVLKPGPLFHGFIIFHGSQWLSCICNLLPCSLFVPI